MGKLKRLAGETVLYGLGSIIPRFLNFLLVRLHTDVFPPEEYGIITKLLVVRRCVQYHFYVWDGNSLLSFATKLDADEKRIFNLAQTVVIRHKPLSFCYTYCLG